MSNTCQKLTRKEGAFHAQPCGRPARHEFAGHHYCGLHDPLKNEDRQRSTLKTFATQRSKAEMLDILLAQIDKYVICVNTSLDDYEFIFEQNELNKVIEQAKEISCQKN